MPDGHDDVVMRRLHDRAEKIREEGGVSTTLAMQILADLTIVSDRLNNAEGQRLGIDAKLDRVLAEQHRVALLAAQVEATTHRLTEMQKDILENTEFRLKFLGGSTVAKMVYALAGGGLAVGIEYILTKV